MNIKKLKEGFEKRFKTNFNSKNIKYNIKGEENWLTVEYYKDNKWRIVYARELSPDKSESEKYPTQDKYLDYLMQKIELWIDYLKSNTDD